ncbi:MAG: hypothetical protein WCC00_10410 [Candidatus Aminicenantales bacterium]
MANQQAKPAHFFSTGFAVIEQDGDYGVYREYRIKNLPEVLETRNRGPVFFFFVLASFGCDDEKRGWI